MSILDRFRSQSRAEAEGYEPLRIDDTLAETLTREPDVPTVTVRPNKDNGGIEAMDDVLESLHNVETESPRFSTATQNVSAAYTLEMRYASPLHSSDAARAITMQYHASDPGQAGLVERQLQNQYPDSQVDRASDPFLAVTSGQYVAAAELDVRRYTLYPIRNIDLDGFRSDPTGSILEEMVGSQEDAATDADVICQLMFRPAGREWTHGVSDGHGRIDNRDENVLGDPGINDLAYNLRQPTFERNQLPLGKTPLISHIPDIGYETLEYAPTTVDKQVANLLEEQQGEKGWQLCLRVLAVSDDPDVAIDRASRAAGMFRNFYESNTEQTFIPRPLAGDTARKTVEAAATRRFEETGIVKAQREVAGLVNIPTAEHVNTNKMRWSLAKPGEGIPPDTPRCDFDAHDVTGASTSEKQLAMLDTDDSEAPYWFGFGRKHGIEAGITPETLNTHMFVGGGTGKGKTTFLTNLLSQIMQRGHGGLAFDPKGVDADAFIREWPEDRPVEDFIFVDLSDDFEKQVRFNFLEVPTDAPPDSQAFATAVEALCDDLVAMMAQVGGDDQYWGALMNRVARTLIRGMAKSDRTCTLLDLACCCAGPENRQQFHEWMSEERIHFIEEAARRIRMKEEDDLEPLAGRLDQWIQNDAVRNLISATESTVSLQEVVEEGKVIVVRNAPTSGETEKRLFATALIRRAWVAARESTDAPQFHVVCDEFDSIVTQQSNIHKILSEARAFDFCLTLACQNPSNQLPDRVVQAISNQCETFITYNPGGRRDAKLIQAQHSSDVGWEDLTNLSKYRFYMRTHDSNDELTHSYKVDAFSPAAEVRQEVTGEAGMSDEDLQWFKRRSIARNGTDRPTPLQQKQESHFYDIGRERMDRALLGGEGEPEDVPRIPPTDDRRHRVCKALYDEALDRGVEDGYVLANECADRISEYLDVAVEHRSQLWTLIDEIPEEYVESETRDGRVYLRCTGAGATAIFQTGPGTTSGGPGHRALLKDAYGPLTTLGLRTDLPEQTGADQPDGVGTAGHLVPSVETTPTMSLDERQRQTHRVAEEFSSNHPRLARLTDGGAVTIEAEASTGETKPAQTLFNLAQAVNSGRRCLFVCREDVAPSIWTTLTDPPYCTTHGVAEGTRFYNHLPLRIDGDEMLRPATGERTVWTRDEDGGYRLSDHIGEEYARFPTASAVFEDPSRYPATSATVDADDDAWVPVPKPFLPEQAFDGDGPDVDDWHILVIPSNATDPADLRLYVDGGQVPFTDLERFRTAPDTGDRTHHDDSEPFTASSEAHAERGAFESGDPAEDGTEPGASDEGDEADDGDGSTFRRF